MAQKVRTTVIIDGKKLNESEFDSVSLSQSIGAHHSFEVRMTEGSISQDITDAVTKWSGKRISIGFDRSDDSDIGRRNVTEVFKGVVTSVNLARRSGKGSFVIRGSSSSIVLEDGEDTRSFTEMGLDEIVNGVLEDYNAKLEHFGNKPIVDPKEFREVLPYTVQYKESQFAFLNRLANTYGEWFYDDGIALNFGRPDLDDPVQLDFQRKSLLSFEMTTRAIPLNFEMKGYDYTQHKSLEETAPQQITTNDLGKHMVKVSADEVFDQSTMTPVNEHIDENELSFLVQRNEQIKADELIMLSASSTEPKIRLGQHIEIFDSEFHSGSLGVFSVISISHNISQSGSYTNQMMAVPAEVSAPPLSAFPRPNYCESQLAKVVNIADPDALGRIKVVFQWQEGTDETSPWLRVMSPYAGKERGFYATPELDDQVLIGFESDNPDKPYVLTSTYNADSSPTHYHHENNILAFITKINQFIIDDGNGSITINAENTLNLSASNEININVTGSAGIINVAVGGDKSDMHLNGEEILIHATKKLTAKSDDEANLLGKQVNVGQADATYKLTSKKADLWGSDLIKVKGDQVQVNGSTKTALTGGGAKADLAGGQVKLNS